MQTKILNWQNQEVGNIDLDESIFGVTVRPDIVHRVVTWQRAKARAGTHKTKQRNEVSGSTRKIYNQKGGGRARHGSKKAPIFVGGGIVFGPVVRSHEFKLNKKVRQLGIKSALSSCFKEGNIIVMDSVEIKQRKTSLLLEQLSTVGLKENKVLICDAVVGENLRNSSANLHKINVLPVEGINVIDLLKHEKVILTTTALEKLQERLKK